MILKSKTKVPFGKKGFKYFIGDKDAKILNFHVYRKDFDETKYISFLIKYNELLEKYN